MKEVVEHCYIKELVQIAATAIVRETQAGKKSRADEQVRAGWRFEHSGCQKGTRIGDLARVRGVLGVLNRRGNCDWMRKCPRDDRRMGVAHTDGDCVRRCNSAT